MAGEIATIVAAVIGLVAVLFAAIEWQRRKGELALQDRAWLSIPAPGPDQSPLTPGFWVYPPIENPDGGWDVVVAGTILNAGPGDAFSVRIYAELELAIDDGGERLRTVLGRTVKEWIVPLRPGEDPDDLYRAFVAAYKRRADYLPLLRRGQEEHFVVVAHYPQSTEYLERIIVAEGDEAMALGRSRPWTLGDTQAHPVHAAARTALGTRLPFAPGDLCAPFESERDLARWAKGPP